MGEWWTKSTTGRTRVTRWWNYTAPFRRRFGFTAGMRTARAFSVVEFVDVVAAPVPVRVPGWAAPVWLRPGTSDAWVFRQLILGGELDIPLPPARRVIDGGANIGLASRLFAHRWPEAEIVAVELQPENAVALRQNLLQTPTVKVPHGALWG